MITFISRRRNTLTNELLYNLADADYNFDYRGKSNVMLIIKAFITASEIEKSEIYFYEGMACAYVSCFLKPGKTNIWYCNGPDFYNIKKASWFKKYIFKKLLRNIDTICVISAMIKTEAEYYFPEKKIYNIGIYVDKKIDGQKIKDDKQNKKIIMSVDRPNETGYIKGLDIALKQFKYLYSKDPKYSLTLIGRGTDQLKLPTGVKGLGYVNVDEILINYRFVLVSSRYDAYNLFAHEAMIKGLIPLLSVNCGLTHELELQEIFMLDTCENGLYILLSKLNKNIEDRIAKKFNELSILKTKEKMISNIKLLM